MTAPYLDDGDIALYHGDALSVLRSLPAGCAQTCVTSPPYWGLRDYGTGSWLGGAADCDHLGAPFRTKANINANCGTGVDGKNALGREPMGETCSKCGARRVDDQLGLEATPDQYVARLVLVMREVWRVLRADGTLFLNLGDSYAGSGPSGASYQSETTKRRAAGNGQDGAFRVSPTLGDRGLTYRDKKPHDIPTGLKPKDLVGVPWRVAFALQASGWYLRSDIIWAKPNPMPESVTDRPTKAHEYVFLLSKQPRYYYDADAIREPATPDGIAREGRARLSAYDAPGQTANRRTTSDGAWLEAGRNARSVWEIATQPTPEAHFATYPEALVRRCILAGTSEAGGCSVCGAPWQRQTSDEREPTGHGGRSHNGNRDSSRKDVGVGEMTRRVGVTLGWAASCACGAPPQAQVVLDPFVGSGTTALVARKHGRRAIGIDLSSEYLAIAARRTAQLSLLGEGAA